MFPAAPSTPCGAVNKQAAGRGTFTPGPLATAYPLACATSPRTDSRGLLACRARDVAASGGLLFGVAGHVANLEPQEVARLSRWQSGLVLSDDGKPYGNFCNVKAHSCIGVAHQYKE